MSCTPTEPLQTGRMYPRSLPATTPRCPDNRRELRVHATVNIRMHLWSSHTAEYKSLRKVANHVYDQLIRETFPCPRSRLRIWFRETGLTVPSLVSLLILYTNAESGAYSRYSSRIPRRRPYIFASNTHHRVSPEFIGSRNCVPIAFTAEIPLAQG